ncbi:hypothetical protein PanWU01x14_089530, partial [Parasponia andersonii]
MDGKTKNGVWEWLSYPKSFSSPILAFFSVKASLLNWHHHLGHLSFKIIKNLCPPVLCSFLVLINLVFLVIFSSVIRHISCLFLCPLFLVQNPWNNIFKYLELSNYF